MLYYGHDASIKSGEIMSENLIHTLLSDMLQDRDQKTARLQQANIELQTFQALSGAIRKYLIEVAEAIQGEPEDSKRLNIYAKAINDLAAFTRNEPARMAKNLEMGRVEINTYNSLIEKIHQIDLPENLVEQELAIISQGLKKEDFEKNKKESENTARKRIKLGLILNEIGEKNSLKVEEEELRNEIKKQIQQMPGQQKQILEYYQKNPSVMASLRGSIYEEKIIKLIKEKCKKSKKSISAKEADQIIAQHQKDHDHSHENESKKSKKTNKSPIKSKKIRKK